ncbi:MAG: hypothetical protein ABN479_19685 [Billgrantia sp.]
MAAVQPVLAFDLNHHQPGMLDRARLIHHQHIAFNHWAIDAGLVAHFH